MPSTSLQDERFLLLEALGRGGMGQVYRAFDRAEQQLVALKVTGDAELPGPEHPLALEFEAWSRLCHPNIVRVHELATARTGPLASGRPYLVLEHVRGGPAHHLLTPGRAAPMLIEKLAVAVLRALAHVHRAGYVHRDLKPANVLVAPRPRCGLRVKLTDFGLAAPAGWAGAPGRISGSLPYVSPEALLGQPLDGRADLYGLGILLFQLAAGEIPARGGPEEILRWHLDGPPADPTRHRQLPGRLARLIRRLTERDRADRPASAAAALGLLGQRCGHSARTQAQTLDRAERAKLRMALDAVRLGASRLFELPASPAEAAPLLHEVSVWAQVRGLRFFTLSGGGAGEPGSLSRLVLRLLAERGGEAAECLTRYGLGRALPLGVVGGLPILDPPTARRRSRADASPSHAAGICRFLLDSAERRSIVLSCEPAGEADPLVREVARQLRLRVAGSRASSTHGGGLLLLAVTTRPAS